MSTSLLSDERVQEAMEYVLSKVVLSLSPKQALEMHKDNIIIIL